MELPLIRVLSNLCDPFAIILRNLTNGPPHFPVIPQNLLILLQLFPQYTPPPHFGYPSY